MYMGDIMSTLWDTMMHVRDIIVNVGGYHENIRGCSVHRGFQF